MPYFCNEYWYIIRYEKGKEYPIFCRKHQSLENIEEIILDVNSISEGKKFADVGSGSVSSNNELLAYSTDFVGRRIYSLCFKNLKTGEVFQDKIPNTTGKAIWANDNQHVFYVRKDKNLRAFQVFRHQLGTDSSQDILVFHEKDDTFDVHG